MRKGLFGGRLDAQGYHLFGMRLSCILDSWCPNLRCSVVWQDLTVADAERISDLSSAVVGWKHEPVAMGDFSDFHILALGSNDPAAWICHARSSNAALPPQWLIYITVADLDAAIAACASRGGAGLIEEHP